MPAHKSSQPAAPVASHGAPVKAKPDVRVAPASAKAVAKTVVAPQVKTHGKAPPLSHPKAPPVPLSKSNAHTASKSDKKVAAHGAELKKPAIATLEVDLSGKKKPGRPAKPEAVTPPPRIGAKRGPKPKGSLLPPEHVEDLQDIVAEFDEEPALVNGEKVKPLRMKISKAKERALMKEFGLDETILSEEDLAKRRQRLKALIKLGKTRGYLTHGEISDHLPDKLVDAETLEVVISMLNDMGVAVYEQTPDAETLLLNNTVPTAATEEEAEEEAEAALSTVDSAASASSSASSSVAAVGTVLFSSSVSASGVCSYTATPMSLSIEITTSSVSASTSLSGRWSEISPCVR